MKKKPVSPLATGGAGTIFEYRVAALMLAYLLRGQHAPGLETPTTQVGLQQRVRDHLLDDIVVYGEPASLRTEFQVKQTLTVTRSDESFIEVVTQVMHVLHDQREAVAKGDLALGLIAEGEATPVSELATLTKWAQAHTSHRSFTAYMAKGIVKASLRNRLSRVQEAVETAVADGAPSLGTIEQTTHQFLAALHVWQPALGDDGETYLAALDSLKSIADEHSTTPASLFAHLATLAQSWGPFGGTADSAHVLRRLRRRGLVSRLPERSASLTEPDVDAVVRGPVEALGLRPELEAAEASLAEGNPAAVDAFEALATKLTQAAFLPDAVVMLRRKADAMEAAGQGDDAVLARVGIAWDELDRVRVWEAGFALHDGRLSGAPPRLEALTQRVQAIADAAVAVAKGMELTSLGTAFDALHETDPYIARAAVFVCEQAIAEAQPQLITERLDRLEAVVQRAVAASETEQRFVTRIQMCIADATGNWTPLMRTAVRTLPRKIVPWLYARYARHLALTGDGPGALEHYLEAVERATVEKMLDDAADWLYAMRTTAYWYDLTHRDEQHPRAQAIRPHAKPSKLPGGTHTAELALQSMLNEDKPFESLQRVRRWRWQAVVRAQLAEELTTCKRLGTLLQRRGFLDEAVQSFIRADDADGATKASNMASSRLENLVPANLGPIPTVRAAAFRAATANSDLLDDDAISAWAEAALAEVALPPGERISPTAAPYKAAFSFLAAACGALTPDQRQQLGLLVQPIVDDPRGIELGAHEYIGDMLVTMAAGDATIIPLLCRGILADNRTAERIFDNLQLVHQHRDQIADALTPHVGTCEKAGKAIIMVEGDASAVVSLARAKVEQELLRREPVEGVMTFEVGAPDAAIFARILDQQERNHFASVMVDRALDHREAKANRYNYICGVFNIAEDLDGETKRRLLPSVIEIARGEHEDGPTFFDADLPLAPVALRCASKLSPNASQAAEIQQIGLADLLAADEVTQWSIAKSIASLPPDQALLDLSYCAVHPSPAIRTLAAIRWTQDPEALPAHRALALARDPDFRVRRELARTLPSDWRTMTSTVRDVGEVLSEDPRRNIRVLANGGYGHA